MRQIVKYFAGYFDVCPEANLTILQHIWNASHHPLSSPDQAEGWEGREDICLWEDFLCSVGHHGSHPAHPAWVFSVQFLSPVNISPGVNIGHSEGHWDTESRYNDCLWSVSVPAPGPRVVTQSWHCHAVTRLVWCDVMSGAPRQTLMGHRPRQADLHTHWPAASGSWDELSWPIPGWSQALMSDLWLPRDLGARHCLGHSHNLYRGYIGT